jgi:hypothetical protein
MKTTPVQELLELEAKSSKKYVDVSVGVILLCHIRENRKELLKEEKELMIKFSGAYHRYVYGLDNLTMDGYPIPPKPEEELNISEFYDKYFKTKER